MKIASASQFLESGSGLKDVKITKSDIIIELKNGSTLTISPVISDDGVTPVVCDDGSVIYEMDLMTGRENKVIQRKIEKINALMKEIQDVKNGAESESASDDDEEIIDESEDLDAADDTEETEETFEEKE